MPHLYRSSSDLAACDVQYSQEINFAVSSGLAGDIFVICRR